MKIFKAILVVGDAWVVHLILIQCPQFCHLFCLPSYLPPLIFFLFPFDLVQSMFLFMTLSAQWWVMWSTEIQNYQSSFTDLIIDMEHTCLFSASKLKVKFVLQCSSSVFAVRYTMLCQMWTLQWYLFVLNILDMFFVFFLLPFILHNMTQKGQKQNIFLWCCLFHLWVIKLHTIVGPSYACRSSGRWFVCRSAVFLLVHQNRSCLLHYLQVKIAAVGIIHIIVCNGRWLIA